MILQARDLEASLDEELGVEYRVEAYVPLKGLVTNIVSHVSHVH